MREKAATGAYTQMICAVWRALKLPPAAISMGEGTEGEEGLKTTCLSLAPA